jgi:DNA-binding NtrC family response regulator
LERVLIQEVLQRTRWNRAEAARLLQISTKALGSLGYKLQELPLSDVSPESPRATGPST